MSPLDLWECGRLDATQRFSALEALCDARATSIRRVSRIGMQDHSRVLLSCFSCSPSCNIVVPAVGRKVDEKTLCLLGVRLDPDNAFLNLRWCGDGVLMHAIPDFALPYAGYCCELRTDVDFTAVPHGRAETHLDEKEPSTGSYTTVTHKSLVCGVPHDTTSRGSKIVIDVAICARPRTKPPTCASDNSCYI